MQPSCPHRCWPAAWGLGAHLSKGRVGAWAPTHRAGAGIAAGRVALVGQVFCSRRAWVGGGEERGGGQGRGHAHVQKWSGACWLYVIYLTWPQPGPGSTPRPSARAHPTAAGRPRASGRPRSARCPAGWRFQAQSPWARTSSRSHPGPWQTLRRLLRPARRPQCCLLGWQGARAGGLRTSGHRAGCWLLHQLAVG